MRAAPLIHKCTGAHSPEEGGEEHDCACPIGHDHTVQEYWEFDGMRDDDDD